VGQGGIPTKLRALSVSVVGLPTLHSPIQTKERIMSALELIAPQKTVRVSFSIEPAFNVLCSLFLLNADVSDFEEWDASDFGEWVSETAAKLSPEQLETNKRVCDAAFSYLGSVSWPSFPAWLDDLAARDAYELRDYKLEEFLRASARSLGEPVNQLAPPARLLADRATYLSLCERVHERQRKPFDRARHEQEYEMLQDPLGSKEMMVAHLRLMWNEYMAVEWERTQPMLQDSVTAFESLDFSGMSTSEILRQVTGRENLACIEDNLPGVEEIIITPSVHNGPYMIMWDFNDGTTVRIVDCARIPEGATVRSPALSRSELLMRMSALSDDTRLSILELVARDGEQNAKEIMAQLDLTQSAVSRHLRQLVATGYLIVRRHKGAKRYRLNRDRVDDTFSALKSLLP